ncbi:MAG: ribosome recycling factor [Planctomycetes bacterium]|nr:ribosome recycling factor [Planctomycetota bacterium]
MDLDTIMLECEDRMEKSVEHLQKELRGMRTGRATTAMLEYIKVDYYGSLTDLRELAAISVPEPAQLLVKPFDPGAKSEIVKAIEKAGLGLNPQTEGAQIRIMVPSPSSDRRKQLSAQAKKLSEDTKVAIRNERRDANKRIDTLLADKKSGLTEDAAERAQKDVDEATKKQTAKVDEIVTKKVSEIEET